MNKLDRAERERERRQKREGVKVGEEESDEES